MGPYLVCQILPQCLMSCSALSLEMWVHDGCLVSTGPSLMVQFRLIIFTRTFWTNFLSSLPGPRPQPSFLFTTANKALVWCSLEAHPLIMFLSLGKKKKSTFTYLTLVIAIIYLPSLFFFSMINTSFNSCPHVIISTSSSMLDLI